MTPSRWPYAALSGLALAALLVMYLRAESPEAAPFQRPYRQTAARAPKPAEGAIGLSQKPRKQELSNGAEPTATDSTRPTFRDDARTTARASQDVANDAAGRTICGPANGTTIPRNRTYCLALSSISAGTAAAYALRPLVVFFVGAEGSGHNLLLQLLGKPKEVQDAVPLIQRDTFSRCVDSAGLSTTDHPAGDVQITKLEVCLRRLIVQSKGTTIASPSWPYGSDRSRALKNGWQLLPTIKAAEKAGFRVRVVYMYRTPSSNHDMRWGGTKNWQQSLQTRSFYLHKLVQEVATLDCFRTLPFYPLYNFPQCYVADLGELLEVAPSRLHPQLAAYSDPGGKTAAADTGRSNPTYVQQLDQSLQNLTVNPLTADVLLGPPELAAAELRHLLHYAPQFRDAGRDAGLPSRHR